MSGAVPAQGAAWSDCGCYRYAIWEIWDAGRPTGLFAGWNPSVAGRRDEAGRFVEDATFRKYRGYGRRWGWGGFYGWNLYGLSATDPEALKSHPDPVGAENDGWFDSLCERMTGPLVIVWGGKAAMTDRAHRVLADAGRSGRPLYCIRLTGDGHPAHACRGAYTAAPVPFAVGFSPADGSRPAP